jgi:hypothetical protein
VATPSPLGYHLYNHRHYNNQTKIPYTLEDLETDSFRAIWGEILALSGIGIVVAGVLSPWSISSAWWWLGLPLGLGRRRNN